MYLGLYERLGVHVYAGWREVVRAAALKLTRRARRDPLLRADRKTYYREILKHHDQALRIVVAWRL